MTGGWGGVLVDETACVKAWFSIMLNEAAGKTLVAVQARKVPSFTIWNFLLQWWPPVFGARMTTKPYT